MSVRKRGLNQGDDMPEIKLVFDERISTNDNVIRAFNMLNWALGKLSSKNVKRLDTNETVIKSADGSTEIKGPQIIMKDSEGNIKLIQGLDNDTGVFVFTLEDGVITGGKIQTAKTGTRIEITGNKLTTYNAEGQMHGPRIYPGDGDIVWSYKGVPVLSIGLASADGNVMIQPLSLYKLIIEGYPTYDWVLDKGYISGTTGYTGTKTVGTETWEFENGLLKSIT
jgi:hypothetical protein